MELSYASEGSGATLPAKRRRRNYYPGMKERHVGRASLPVRTAWEGRPTSVAFVPWEYWFAGGERRKDVIQNRRFVHKIAVRKRERNHETDLVAGRGAVGVPGRLAVARSDRAGKR